MKCKYCGGPIEWGIKANGRYISLVPARADEFTNKDFVDANGVLRSSHRPYCDYVEPIRVLELSKPIEPGE